MSSFEEIEARREFTEALDYEEWLETRTLKRCPGCGVPVEWDALCCDECFWEET